MKYKFKIGDIVKMFDPPSNIYRFIIGIDRLRYYFYEMHNPDAIFTHSKDYMEQAFVKVKQ